jgi:hypothetical protein
MHGHFVEEGLDSFPPYPSTRAGQIWLNFVSALIRLTSGRVTVKNRPLRGARDAYEVTGQEKGEGVRVQVLLRSDVCVAVSGWG